MDKQYRITRWSEWKIGERYLWSKGGQVLVGPRECVEVNRTEGYVAFKTESGDTVQHWSWENRWTPVGLYVLASKRQFGVGRIVDLDRLAWWIRSRMVKRKTGNACRTCAHFHPDLLLCLHNRQYLNGNAQHTAPENWCIWFSKYL